jgi:uncharacterized protein (DUF4415 family)
MTDWERVDSLPDEGIDLSDSPEITPEMFARATVRRAPADGRQATVHLDADLLAWFKAQGKGYQQRINAVLRAYKEAHQES